MPMAQYPNNPSMTEIRYKHLRFLITDSPADESVHGFIEVIKRKNNIKNILFLFLF